MASLRFTTVVAAAKGKVMPEDKDTVYRTHVIQEEFEKAYKTSRDTLEKALVRARSLTKEGHIVERQQAYIRKLQNMLASLDRTRQEPLT